MRLFLTLITIITGFFRPGLKLLASQAGEITLPVLNRQRRDNKAKMTALFKNKDKWSPEDRKQYDDLLEKSKIIEADIIRREEYEKQIKADLSRKPEHRELAFLNRKANIVNMIKSQAPKNWGLKIDDGPIKEAIQERHAQFPEIKAEGGMPILNEDLIGKGKKRTAITTADDSGGALVTEDIQREIIDPLYEKTWSGRIGARFYRNLQGDFVIPALKTKSSSGYTPAGEEAPDSALDYEKRITLKPLRIAVKQSVTKTSLLQDSTMMLQQNIGDALQSEFAVKVDSDMLNNNADLTKRPKGILNTTGIQVKDASSNANAGAALTFGLIKDCESLLEDNNQEKKGTWLINSRTAGFARKTLRNAVMGSNYIMKNEMFGDMQAILTNIVSRTRVKGTSGPILSDAILVVPDSIAICSWYLPTLEVDFSIGRGKSLVWLFLTAWNNVAMRRAKDLVHLKNLTS